MKAAPTDLPRLQSKIGAMGGALVHGEDRGLVREIATNLARQVQPELSDPFLVVAGEADAFARDPARLNDELNQIGLFGGRRILFVREAADRHTALLDGARAIWDAAKSEAAFLVVEAGELLWRSSLKALFEESKYALSIACGIDAKASLDLHIKNILAPAGLSLESEAREALMERLQSEPQFTRGALEKLVLYKGKDTSPVTRADVVAAVEDAESAAIENVVDCAFDGALDRLEKALRRALAQGISPVTLIRAALRNGQRMDLAMRLAAAGRGLDDAIGALRPPPPYSVRGAFAARCRSWRLPALERALSGLLQAEADCKTTALPDEAICGQAFYSLARLKRA